MHPHSLINSQILGWRPRRPKSRVFGTFGRLILVRHEKGWGGCLPLDRQASTKIDRYQESKAAFLQINLLYLNTREMCEFCFVWFLPSVIRSKSMLYVCSVGGACSVIFAVKLIRKPPPYWSHHWLAHMMRKSLWLWYNALHIFVGCWDFHFSLFRIFISYHISMIFIFVFLSLSLDFPIILWSVQSVHCFVGIFHFSVSPPPS